MKNSGNANADIERALDYIKGVARMEKRFHSRSQYRWRLQAMAEGGSLCPLTSVSEGNFKEREARKARLEELDRKLVKELIKLQAVREQTWELFSRLSHPNAWQILEEFYLNGTPIRVIAAQNAYNERYVYRVKKQALRELGKLLRENGIEDPQ